MIRLQKVIAINSKYSRRKAEELILHGRVRINGNIVTELGVKIDPNIDKIQIDHDQLQISKHVEHFYVKLYKPRGYLCTVQDSHNRETVIDLLPEFLKHVYPVGRLDKESEGLLLLTNDGDFALKYTHPRYGHEKEYLVEINGRVTKNNLKQLQQGIEIDGYQTKDIQVRIVLEKINNTVLSFVLKEGRKRQIREIVSNLGRKVISLKRIRINDITLEGLKVGEWKKFKG